MTPRRRPRAQGGQCFDGAGTQRGVIAASATVGVAGNPHQLIGQALAPLRKKGRQHVVNVYSLLAGRCDTIAGLALVRQDHTESVTFFQRHPGCRQRIVDPPGSHLYMCLVVPAPLAQIYEGVAEVEQDGGEYGHGRS